MEKFGKKYSGCINAQIGAGLFSKDDSYEPILGANGVVDECCIDKEYCSRIRCDDVQLEFGSCLSACAEASVLIGAMSYLPDFDNSYLISTRSPCERCAAYMGLFLGDREILKEYYFGDFKVAGKPRDKDNFHLDILIASGIKVRQIKSAGGKKYEIVDVEQAHDLNGPYYKDLGLRLPNPISYAHIDGSNLPLSRKLTTKTRKRIFGKKYWKDSWIW